ncbi:hypothetical protein AAFF_G00392700 [Aldrovandia affinis]|uniref:Reverse transcriptase n=1 Tax=Aldrovandia affinis TaxID=143900 RepID=A0AAD7WL15_9TELE|nr:hypothetical protein AAFF_G00392700 [Aldrovandia affinis]
MWNLIDERKMAKIRREQKRGLRRWRMEDEEYRRLDKEVKKSCRNDRRSNISSTRNVEKDVRTRIGKATGVFQRLRNIWSSNAITTAIKLRLYMSVVIPTATYACETWMKTASITNMLDVFHRRCLRTIFKISWRDHITNAEVMRRTGVALLSDWLDMYSDCQENDQRVWQWTGCQRVARGREGGQRRCGDTRLRKT